MKGKTPGNAEVLLLPAMYNSQNVLPQHQGNPLLEALPRFRAAREILEALQTIPPFSEEDRRKDSFLRMLSVLELSNFFVPVEMHFRVVEQIGLVVYEGYANRNPATADYRKAQIEFYRQRMEGAIVPIGTPNPSTAPSFSIFGVSGMGKSSIVERILSFYPQALYHGDYCNRSFQLVWLKIDCPLDGSLKQLLLSIIAQVDRILGTSHGGDASSRDGVDGLVVQVAKIAVKHNLGVLIIDEIQNLLDAPGVGLSKMLNFFVTLANDVKVPFVTVGTPKAERILKTMFREARRVGDKGTINWDRMKLGEEWDYFIAALWHFQWTAKPTPLTDDLSEKLFEETQGITALAVRLYQLVQLEAIRSEREVITKGLISKVASENFSLLKNALDALREGKALGIAAFEDFFDLCVDEVDEKLNDVSLRRTSAVPDSNKSKAKKAKDKLKGNLIDFGVPEKRAAAIAAEHYSRPNVDPSLVREISEWVANDDVALSLLAVFEKAKASGSDVVSAFEAAGLLIRE